MFKQFLDIYKYFKLSAWDGVRDKWVWQSRWEGGRGGLSERVGVAVLSNRCTYHMRLVNPTITLEGAWCGPRYSIHSLLL